MQFDDDDFDEYLGDEEESWEDSYEGGNPDDWDGGDWQDEIRRSKRKSRRDPEEDGLDSDFDGDDDFFDEDDLLAGDDFADDDFGDDGEEW